MPVISEPPKSIISTKSFNTEVIDYSDGIARELQMQKIDPTRCRPWKYHNRDSAWLTTEHCQDLINSIRKFGQNHPALVRAVTNDPNYDFELIYGVRRWFACSMIPNQTLLVQITNADDKACMILMHAENACSKDISEFERAYSFAQQMKSGVFKNQTEMADAMGVTQGTISKMIKAAEILDYPWLGSLFQNKLDIPVKLAYLLSVLLKDPKIRDIVHLEASMIGNETEIANHIQNATDILKRLINCTKSDPLFPSNSIVLMSDKKPIILCRRDKGGKVSITIEREAKNFNRQDVEAACLKVIADYIYGLFPGE